MSRSRRNQILIFGIIALVIALADQMTKHIVLTCIPVNGKLDLVPGFLNLVHARNPGAAFGFMAEYESDYRLWFFVGVSVAAVVTITVMVAASPGLGGKLLVGYSCFMGGALGNLVDRVRFGEVVDFIDVYWGRVHWPAFNVADSALCLGTALFLICLASKRG
jgi:signal peptidase II